MGRHDLASVLPSDDEVWKHRTRTWPQWAHATGVHRDTVRKHLRDRGWVKGRGNDSGCDGMIRAPCRSCLATFTVTVAHSVRACPECAAEAQGTGPIVPHRSGEVVRLYGAGKSLQEVGERIGISKSRVAQPLEAAGVERRGNGWQGGPSTRPGGLCGLHAIATCEKATDRIRCRCGELVCFDTDGDGILVVLEARGRTRHKCKERAA